MSTQQVIVFCRMDGSFLNRFEDNGTAVFKRGSDNAGRFDSGDERIKALTENSPFYMSLSQGLSTAGQRLKQKRRQARSDAMVRRHAAAGNSSVRDSKKSVKLKGLDWSNRNESEPC